MSDRDIYIPIWRERGVCMCVFTWLVGWIGERTG